MSLPEVPWKEHVKAMREASAPRVSVEHLHGEFSAKLLDAVDQIKLAKEEAQEEARQAKERRAQEEEAMKALEKERDGSERKSVLTADVPAPEASASKVRTRKKKKKEDVNVFQDFGKEHDDAPIQEVKVNGMVFYKLNYERYWQSDRDLQRWAESLQHNIRYEKLLYKVRDRWHEDLVGDRLQLKISHNPLVRSRSQRYRPTSVSTSLQLKDLQKQIAPKENKKKKMMTELASKSDGGLFGAIFGRDEGAPAKEETEEFNDFGLREVADDASAPRSESGDVPERQDTSASSRRKLSQLEDQHDFTGEEGATDPPASRGRSLQMPTTMALLLFRNAERLHGGETMFIKRWPPAGGLKELLQLAGQACKPVVAPARALYDVNMKPLLSLDEVQPGGTYLVKGLEAFDPPKLFFNHDPVEAPQVPSLRNLIKAKETVAGERDVLDQFSQVPSYASQQLRASVEKEALPTADSPPWLSRYGPLVFPQKAREWQLNDPLQQALSWSCQGPSHRHFYWHEWSPVLQTRIHHKRIDRFASTGSF